jgi:hypothetical protein
LDFRNKFVTNMCFDTLLKVAENLLKIAFLSKNETNMRISFILELRNRVNIFSTSADQDDPMSVIAVLDRRRCSIKPDFTDEL